MSKDEMSFYKNKLMTAVTQRMKSPKTKWAATIYTRWTKSSWFCVFLYTYNNILAGSTANRIWKNSYIFDYFKRTALRSYFFKGNLNE